MNTLLSPCIDRRNIVALNLKKGGDDSLLPEEEDLIVNENGFALRMPQARRWLRIMINDPANHKFGRDRNCFVRKAIREAGVGRRTALALFSLFGIRGSEALDSAFERYEREDKEE